MPVTTSEEEKVLMSNENPAPEADRGQALPARTQDVYTGFVYTHGAHCVHGWRGISFIFLEALLSLWALFSWT